jgi:hypothetical protein
VWTTLAAPGAKSITFWIRSIFPVALRPGREFRYFATGPGDLDGVGCVPAVPPPHATIRATATNARTELFI